MNDFGKNEEKIYYVIYIIKNRNRRIHQELIKSNSSRAYQTFSNFNLFRNSFLSISFVTPGGSLFLRLIVVAMNEHFGIMLWSINFKPYMMSNIILTQETYLWD